LVQQGLRLLAETGTGNPAETVGLLHDEEDYDNLIHLEDESDDKD
jgi:hypothetical protein